MAHTERKKKTRVVLLILLAAALAAGACFAVTRVILPSSRYRAAVKLYEAGKYEEAAAAFEALGEYRDSAARRNALRFLIVPVGGTVSFGRCEQDNDPDNGKEEIEWIVLERGEDRILVIRKYALDGRRYNTSSGAVSWESCSLRQCLNADFLQDSFTEQEQAWIPVTTVSADRNPMSFAFSGNDTQDKLFLLSITDLDEYFPTDAERECQPTAWALAHGAQAKESNGNCWWWLRLPGAGSNLAPRVNCYGSLRAYGPPVTSGYSCVRPAMWIDLIP